MLTRLHEISESITGKWDIDLLEFGGEADHVHLLLAMHPNLTPSKFVANLKTVTSRLMRKEFAKELSHFYWKPVLWTRAYCLISAGGAPLSILKKYINNQGGDSSPAKSHKLRKSRRQRLNLLENQSIPADEFIEKAKKDLKLPMRAIFLAGLRYREDLTQKQLGEMIGVKQSNISLMERGLRPIGKNVAKRLAKVFEADYRIFL